MNLVKYCKRAHATDAVEKGRLFVGTFLCYKKIENQALRDEEEGAATPAILDDKCQLVLSEEDNESFLMHSTIKLANGWKIVLPEGLPLWLEQPTFNTFIFCVSDDPEPSIEKANRLGYESFYRITDPVNFGRALMPSLSQHLDSNFGFTGFMGPVNYALRKIQVVNRNNPGPPAKTFSTADFFMKHQHFGDDKEFRFVFLECSNADCTEFSSFNTDGEIIENFEITRWVAKA